MSSIAKDNKDANINEKIKVREVRLIDAAGAQLGETVRGLDPVSKFLYAARSVILVISAQAASRATGQVVW